MIIFWIKWCIVLVLLLTILALVYYINQGNINLNKQNKYIQTLDSYLLSPSQKLLLVTIDQKSYQLLHQNAQDIKVLKEGNVDDLVAIKMPEHQSNIVLDAISKTLKK